MNCSIQVLDCTLRDGGQGIANLYTNGIKTESFTELEKKTIASLLSKSGIDIVELGFMSETVHDMERFAGYSCVEDLSHSIPDRKNDNQIFTGLYVDPDTPIEHIPDHTPELVDGIREILRYSTLQQSLEHCYALSRKGYLVFIQPMLTMRYTNDELKRLVYAANEMKAYALYVVDSFGYMNERDVERIYRFLIDELDPSIRVGFHAHNNMENAFSNSRFFIEKLNERNRIIDACAIGMGQGAGNLQTEVLVNYLNKSYKEMNETICYDINCILEVCDILDKFRRHDIEGWGYSPLRFIPAMNGVAYKYAMAMRLQYKMSFAEINNVLTDIPDDLRHRYTPDNLIKLLEMKGKELR